MARTYRIQLVYFQYCLEITHFSDPLARAAEGKFLNVPVLAGSAQNEDDVFVVADEIASLGKVIPVLEEIISDITNVVSGFIVCAADATLSFR